jgi:hypothetical protein
MHASHKTANMLLLRQRMCLVNGGDCALQQNAVALLLLAHIHARTALPNSCC